MIDVTEYLKVGNLIVALLGAAFAAVIWLATWVDRRQKQNARAIETNLTNQANTHLGRLATVEEAVSRIETDIGEIDDRVRHVERSMETVARASEVSEVRVELSGLRAETRKTAGQVDTIYKAAIRAGSNASKS